MNKKNVVILLKEQMKVICKECTSTLDVCQGCPVHKLVNGVIKALDNDN